MRSALTVKAMDVDFAAAAEKWETWQSLLVKTLQGQ